MFQDRPLISVVMSVFNESITELESSVQSILDQTYDNIEFIVVVDNPKNDVLKDYLQRVSTQDARLLIINNEINLGLIKSLNKALNLSKGQFIARMDADDISMPNRLEIQLDFLRMNNKDLVGSSVILINEDGIEVSEMYPPKRNIKEAAKYKTVCFHPTWLARREVFDALNGYRFAKHVEDYDFILRALSYGFNLSNTEELLLKYRIRSASVSNTKFLSQIRNSFELQRKYSKGKILCELDIADHSDKNSAETSRLFHAFTAAVKEKRMFKSIKYGLLCISIEPILLKYFLRQCYAKIKFS
ncbi:glycosyltransferase [Vibrio parahaemolyticus]|uniref:glycosyltransferase n=1 Tax=Vibrio parahaemolyticus TaxID=670 RepID=UPI001D85F7C9|nr:glycosyltransferase [Vibrio parahaemolyticus]EHH2482020.1 glycosyltransferase [Vibrio parahaemolyticus]ELA8096628.1 glycosyltransferase [Vibrio parahaemolyticus]MDF5448285.1 glycosyltransferase [Vibrio parahaemolyticus]MDF5610952.1 glycosyltransferase [Vibrio parahaemolyticus]MEA5328825.1 glycosyltransferase [Vibrio parahaemolyticus]